MWQIRRGAFRRRHVPFLGKLVDKGPGAGKNGKARMASISLLLALAVALLAIFVLATSSSTGNLIADPSFEIVKNRDQFGRVFAKWEGSKYEGDCSFEVGEVPHTGKTSGLLLCNSPGKIRIAQTQDLEPGRYRITAYIRGLDIGTGQWNATTEFMFDDKYIPLKKSGSFGWTPLTYVADLSTREQTGPSFGLFAPGYLWIDDVSMERVGPEVRLTDTPELGREEAPIAPPGPLGAGAAHCPRCGYRNMPDWKKCYACGSPLTQSGEVFSGLAIKPITSFEHGNPFEGGAVVAAHATDGTRSLRVDKPHAVMRAAQNWAGYDYLKADTYVEGPSPVSLTVEIQDTATEGYWTRVNYNTVAPPGASTLILPLRQLYVGEKSRPGRYLILSGITRLVFIPADGGRLFLDNLRLERDTAAQSAFFDGLYAFDFGTGTSPVMDGFTPITPATVYTAGRGYGLKNARVWRAVDALQPDPLYQDFICIESGGLAVDVPNGKYRVFVNIDSPSGFWGEYQVYRERSILAQGKKVLSERMDFKSFQKKYFRFWDTEDLPSYNTFDKYQGAHFSEKVFDVTVKNGQLNLEFQGENWACSVSAVILFPIEKAAEGACFLEYVKEKRRFYFDNAFKRVLHIPSGDSLQPAAEDTRRGYLVFQRDFMNDVYYNDTPYRAEIGRPLAADGFPGQMVPFTMSVLPLQDLGTGTLSVSALAGPQGSIPASAIDVGYVSYRLTRVTNDGGVYTISPRLIVPKNTVALPKGVARRFWLTVRVPAGTAPGVYTGQVSLTPQQGGAQSIPLRFRVRKGALDAVDIPVGPWGGRIGTPWLSTDPATANFGAEMTEKSLLLLRAHGFTMFTGVPYVIYQGFKDGKPALDFSAADAQMADARRYGFLAVNSYGAGVIGIDPNRRDLDKMQEAGFTDYSAFVNAVYSAIERHAIDKQWLPVYWNLSDEPVGDDLKASIENARAYREAFPKGPPFFTSTTSLSRDDARDLNFELAKTLHVATLNQHDEAGVRMLASAGSGWAYYNGGNRWTFGIYLYKAVKEFGLKFRLSWHWNIVEGDPYYALDCREDDYAWANATPDGQLVPSLEFLRIAAGLDDYRYLLTLARLARAKQGTPAARQAEALIRNRMAAFHLGQFDPDPLFGVDGWAPYRRQLADAIETLQ
ncbi:MAG TPA: hypothetical protein VIN93_04775 [Bryobacteraceae bacterium]|jgi:hypothetical protein